MNTITIRNHLIAFRLLSRLFLLTISALFIASCQDIEERAMGNVSFIDESSLVEIVNSDDNQPNFRFYDVNGQKTSFQELTKDKFVVLNYWATWCFACKMTLPALRAVNIEFKDKGVVVFGIITMEDMIDDTYKLDYFSRFVNDRDLGYMSIIDTPERDMWKLFGLDPGGIPTTLIIDPSGNIVKSFTGARSEQALLEEIESLL